MPMVIRIVECVTGFGVRLARDIVKRVGLTVRVRVDIEASDGARTIISRPRRRFTLGELLRGAKPDREHELEDDGLKGAEFI